MKPILLFVSFNILAFAMNAHADYSLANNGKKIECYSDDNYSYDVNARRSTIQFTVEGESLGPQKIFEIKTDSSTFVSYTTKEGTLTLSNQGDTWAFTDEEPYPIKCLP